jgi:hypothetical protein
VPAGAVLTYTLIVTNAGPDMATAVTVTDVLPLEVTYGGAWGDGWDCLQAEGALTCTRPSLGAGLTSSLVITVTAPGSGGILTNTATVSGQELDPDEGDNSVWITTQVQSFYYVYLPIVHK